VTDATTAEQLTWDEFERVLRSDRFATVHDLARSSALNELADGSQATERPAGDGSSTLPSLPNRR
jgi:hypothetical protein